MAAYEVLLSEFLCAQSLAEQMFEFFLQMLVVHNSDFVNPIITGGGFKVPGSFSFCNC